MHSIFNLNNYYHVDFQTKGRYAVLGNLDASTKVIVFALHGQGQRAKYFIQNFKSLKDKGITIIAPEGLHYYYLEGFSGRVGASWMTSENRLVAIENYLSFLDATYKDILTKTSSGIKIHLLGFSQGTATICRWIENTKFNFEQLILWSGTVPPDLDKELIFTRLNGKLLLQVCGNNDPYITPEKEKEIKLLIEKYGLSVTYKYYDGGHDISSSELIKLFKGIY